MYNSVVNISKKLLFIYWKLLPELFGFYWAQWNRCSNLLLKKQKITNSPPFLHVYFISSTQEET